MIDTFLCRRPWGESFLAPNVFIVDQAVGKSQFEIQQRGLYDIATWPAKGDSKTDETDQTIRQADSLASRDPRAVCEVPRTAGATDQTK